MWNFIQNEILSMHWLNAITGKMLTETLIKGLTPFNSVSLLFLMFSIIR